MSENTATPTVYGHHYLLEKLREHRNWLFLFCGVFFLLGIPAIIFHEGAREDHSTALMLAFACFATSFVIGFLFGIPKVVQTDSPPTNGEYQLLINTNLTEVSDWLTKIIVGLGLANLIPISEKIRYFAEYFNNCKPNCLPNADVAYGGGVILYFLSVGLVSGYIITRLYLTEAFSTADRVAISGNLARRMRNIEDHLTRHSRVEYLIKAARILFKDGEFEKSKTLLEAAKRLDPHNESILLTMAHQFQQHGDYEAALTMIDEILDYHRDSPQALYCRGYYTLLFMQANKPSKDTPLTLDEKDLNAVLKDWEKAFTAVPELKKFAQLDEELGKIRPDVPKINTLLDTQNK